MTASEKLLNSIKSARAHLKSSVQALDRKDDDLFDDSLWHVGAELEYALFLFSLAFQNESEVNSSRWKPNPELKKAETSSLVDEVQNLLNDAEKYMMNAKLLEAYKSAYVARHYVLKVQEDLAKKKREAFKKK